MRRTILRTIAILILVPHTFITVLLSAVSVPVGLDRTTTEHTILIPIISSLIAGWVGLVTLWKLYYHFLAHPFRPVHSIAYWIGIVVTASFALAIVAISLGRGCVGAAAFSMAVFLVAMSLGGNCVGAVVFMGLPLLAAGYFSYLMWQLPATPAMDLGSITMASQVEPRPRGWREKQIGLWMIFGSLPPIVGALWFMESLDSYIVLAVISGAMFLMGIAVHLWGSLVGILHRKRG